MTAAEGVARDNLPLQLTSFVGRTEALAELSAFLANSRLITLAGPPGVGKTRLAVQLASQAGSAYSGGVWFVELAPLADPRLVAQRVAEVLAIPEQPGRELLQTLGEALRTRALLLILDNCEHVIGACAQIADYLLRTCVDLGILATSREPLSIAGEHTWWVSSLSDAEARAAVRAAGARCRAGLRGHRGEHAGDRSHLCATEWHSARHGAGRGTGPRARRRAACAAARGSARRWRPLPCPGRRRSECTAAPTDAAGNARLELWLPDRH